MLEAILVSLTFLFIVPFLLYPFLVETDWNSVQTIINGQDLLASMDKVPDGNEHLLQNIMKRDMEELKDNITENFWWLENRRINYGMETVGSVRNQIRVGFNCTESSDSCKNGGPLDEKNYIESILNPTYINGRFVEFYIIPFSYDKLSQTEIDVILICGDKQKDEANDLYFSEIKYLLEKGVGIVGFYDVKPPLNDEIEDEIFGLKPGGGPGAIVPDTFINTNNLSLPNYGIQKYFYGVGINQNFTGGFDTTIIELWNVEYGIRRNNTDCDDGSYCRLDIDTDADSSYELFGKQENYIFTMHGPDGKEFDFEIEKIDPSGNFFTLNFYKIPGAPEDYIFEPFESNPVSSNKVGREDQYVVIETTSSVGSNNAAMVVNGSDETKWRAVWLSDEEDADGIAEDTKALLKSSIIWTSEKRWWNVLRSVSGEHNKLSYFVSQGNEFYEPYWVELTLWSIY